MTFGYLTVLERAPNKVSPSGRSRVRWKCLCRCGKEINVDPDAIVSGRQVSCGCYQKAKTSELFKTHGMTETRLYGVWSAIKGRCYNENIHEYATYGGRGIQMCDEWRMDFKVFHDWAVANGYDENAPRGACTVDRTDCNGNYCPANCRIVSQQRQVNNMRANHMLEYNGEIHTIADWSRITGIDQYKIRNRVAKLGWTTERALTTP